MPAEARIFLEAVAGRDVAHAMAEQAAKVANLLLERRPRGIRILVRVEQQRMPALRANVFMASIAIGQLLVVVLAEEARQRVPHARQRTIFRKILGSAAAPPLHPVGLLEDVVIDVMSPNEARQSG